MGYAKRPKIHGVVFTDGWGVMARKIARWMEKYTDSSVYNTAKNAISCAVVWT